MITFDVDERYRIKQGEKDGMQSKELANAIREDFSEYVAHLQLHMSLQARNLVPTLTQTTIDSREQLLHHTQATIEKLISRQAL